MENQSAISREKAMLQLYLEQMTDEQAQYLRDLIEYAQNPYCFREKFFPLCGITEQESNNIDTAIPNDYAQSIVDLYPDFRKGANVFDYNDPDRRIYGKMVNLYNRFAEHLFQTLKIDKL